MDSIRTALEDADIDVDDDDDVLTIHLGDGRQLILNKHRPMQQLWLSSPFSGASHYRYDAQSTTWRNTRHPDDTLPHKLYQEINSHTDKHIKTP